MSVVFEDDLVVNEASQLFTAFCCEEFNSHSLTDRHTC